MADKQTKHLQSKQYERIIYGNICIIQELEDAKSLVPIDVNRLERPYLYESISRGKPWTTIYMVPRMPKKHDSKQITSAIGLN